MPKAAILIVEDEAIVAADLANMLGQLGYAIAGTAASGEDAVTLAQARRPDLVLMDIRLSGTMDGIEAAEHIRRQSDLPVIYLTAHSDRATLQRAKLTEPFGYLLKPFEELDLESHIQMALYKHQAERKLRESEMALRRLNEELHVANEELRTSSEELQVANEELRTNNETLEARVEERTAELKRRTALLQTLAGELTRAEERERRHLAKVLHDGLQQMLVGARFKVENLRERSQGGPLEPDLQEVADTLTDSLNVSRSLTAELSPTVLYQGGLAAALKWLGRWCEKKYGLAVIVETENDVEVPEEEIRIALFQSVRELLFNVVKHAQVKTAQVRLSHTGDGTVQIVVADRGAGFDPAQVRAQEGITGGIGLSSLRERLELLGGRLLVESAPSRGSRFTILAPLPGPPPSPPELKCAAVPPAGSPPPPPVNGRVIRVVLVDDHAIVRDGLSRALRDESDLTVVGQAANGLEAIEVVRRLRPDVVVMDVSMPKMDGIAATRLLTAEFPLLNVIGLSMFNDEAHHQAMRQAGAAAFLDKSSPAAKVVEAIRICAGVPDKPGRKAEN